MIPTRARLALAAPQPAGGLAASRARFMKNWFAWEAMPIVFIITGALSGATWLLYRSTKRPDGAFTSQHEYLRLVDLATGEADAFSPPFAPHPPRISRPATVPRDTSVVWSRSANPEPWSTIGQDETVKLWHGNHKFEKKWQRPSW